MAQNILLIFSVMLETILTLSDTINYTFYEKIDVFKNHNPYFAQVSTVTLLKSSLADFFLLFFANSFLQLAYDS